MWLLLITSSSAAESSRPHLLSFLVSLFSSLTELLEQSLKALVGSFPLPLPPTPTPSRSASFRIKVRAFTMARTQVLHLGCNALQLMPWNLNILSLKFCEWNLVGQQNVCSGLGALAHVRSHLPSLPASLELVLATHSLLSGAPGHTSLLRLSLTSDSWCLAPAVMTRSGDSVGNESPHSAKVLDHLARTWTRLASTPLDRQLAVVVVDSGASLSLTPNPDTEHIPKHELQSFEDHPSTMRGWGGPMGRRDWLPRIGHIGSPVAGRRKNPTANAPWAGPPGNCEDRHSPLSIPIPKRVGYNSK